MKVYILYYRAYEFDDFDYGSFQPKYISLNKEEVQNKFNYYKTLETSNLNRYIETHDIPEIFKEDYQVDTDSDTLFTLYFGKWCYEYMIQEYELDTELKI